MSVEAAGAVTVLVGLLAVWRGPAFGFGALVPLTLLGAAAAILLGGSGTIQPAHLMLGFVGLAVAGRLDLTPVRQRLRFPRDGFWLAAFTLVSVAGALLLPRMLAQATDINAIGNTDYGPSVMRVPLGPTSGNLTQSIYGLADLACFLLCLAYASGTGGFRHLARALVGYCALNIAFAFIDIATFWTNTGFLLTPIRNADYQLHLETVLSGMKRIIGSFTEASAFAYATLGALGFTAQLCLGGLRPRLFGGLALVSLALLLFSTSSTAYVATPLLLAALYGRTLLCALRRNASPVGLAVLLLAPLALVVLVIGVLIQPTAHAAVSDTLTPLLFDKATSQSGVERAQWNMTALQNVLETHGLGAGLGSVRASSFPVALLANTGLPGLLLFGGFVFQLFFARTPPGIGPAAAATRVAARMACLGLLMAATVSGAMVDMGLPFFVFAALACAEPRPGSSRRSAAATASASPAPSLPVQASPVPAQ